MKNFETYFSQDEIISYLCKLRVKIATSRNKKHLIHLLTDSYKYNYHRRDIERDLKNDSNDFIKYQSQFLKELNRLLPSRKKWVVIGSKSRKPDNSSQPLSTSYRNYYSLIKTIKSFRKKSPNEPWLLELDKYILDIQSSVLSGTYKISSPVIYPKLKKNFKLNGSNGCRPISLFTLKDRIVLSITNKYLTKILDKNFKDCSYAFRSKRNKDDTAILTHHDCIKDLLDYRIKHINHPLWVVECDIEKFYDSVNHKVIKEEFGKLAEKTKIIYSDKDFGSAVHIFDEYLSCYAFNKNVPLKSDKTYWRAYKIPNGEFEWIEDTIIDLGYYEKIEDERIGVPQGGALSGLIANIVLNIADQEVLKTEAFYIRFCDDMLIIHPDLKICSNAKDKYISSLKQLKLIPHSFNENLISGRIISSKSNNLPTLRNFWKGKSKGPYKWTALINNGFPWIGFVGYEIHHEGHIRIRKKSFIRELSKQKEVVQKIRQAIKVGMRRSKGSVTESAIHRLVGMSVGRVTIKNFDKISNDLCWKNGFKELTMNRYSIQQIKQLDRNRNRLYYDLLRDIKEPDVEDHAKVKSKSRQIVHFNKPFSYYYQVLERKENVKKEKSGQSEINCEIKYKEFVGAQWNIRYFEQYIKKCYDIFMRYIENKRKWKF